ncbi:uncharacterized protein BX664DRAFT_388835 [Halteromyces radiatus]|uniref:uncharacterized protein n=1 Tax=Halteromyces radiatus TaxID=101107 RepID=UPI0022208B5D|nr:uncharacterized protein BX664DRAFT_388835 [Halteromyces radiatus]KAI8079863.1 hypothetical protein BX664DRAFT_388835 [Halteromyces radiatus]
MSGLQRNDNSEPTSLSIYGLRNKRTVFAGDGQDKVSNAFGNLSLPDCKKTERFSCSLYMVPMMIITVLLLVVCSDDVMCVYGAPPPNPTGSPSGSAPAPGPSGQTSQTEYQKIVKCFPNAQLSSQVSEAESEKIIHCIDDVLGSCGPF